MPIARFRRELAATGIVAGALVSMAAAVVAMNAIRVVTTVLPSSQLHDTYFVISGAHIGFLIYGVGIAADLALLTLAKRLDRSARAILQIHLVFTTVLLTVALAAASGLLVKNAWHMVLVLNSSAV